MNRLILLPLFLLVASQSVHASMRFGSRSIHDSVKEANTVSTVGNMTDLCHATDTQVHFEDGKECAGDAGFLYGKTVDHASLGPDAAIDKTFTPDNWLTYLGGVSSTILSLPDIRGDWGTAAVNGLEMEFKSTPSGTQGFDNVVLNGITGRFVVDGTAGTTATDKWLVDSLQGSVFNGLVNVSGTGSVDSIDNMTGSTLNSEVLVDLDGAGTNAAGTVVWSTVTDTVDIRADTLTNYQIEAHDQLITYTVPTIDTVLSAGFETETRITATTSLNTFVGNGFQSDVDITTPDLEAATTRHFDVDADYSISNASNNDAITDYGYVYDFQLDGATTADVVNSRAVWTDQVVDVDFLDDNPGAASFTVYGWLATQAVGSASDSGTFDTLRGLDLTQTWSGDISGTTADGIYLSCVAKDGSGTLTTGTCLNLIAPSRIAGTLTNAYTLQLTTPTTGGTENAGIRFADGLTNLIEFEGNTANGFETRVSVVEPTADQTQTLQDATGTIVLTPSAIDFTIQKADPTLIYDVVTATDTDFWVGVQDDAGGDDDDTYQIGKGTTPGTTPRFTMTGAGAISLVDKLVTYNNIATVGNGVPSELATIDTTGLTANVAAATLYTVPSTGEGMYRVSAYVVLTTAGSVSSTLPNVQVVYTDKDSNTSVTLDATPVLGVAGLGQTGALTANTVGTIDAGVVPIYVKASTTIQYQTTGYASTAAGMTYALHVLLEKM